jgi:hypothetical protein
MQPNRYPHMHLRPPATTYRIALQELLDGRHATRLSTLARMGGKNPERERLWGKESDPLIAYARDYELAAHCRRPFCTHRRTLHFGLLLKAFGPHATLAQIAVKMRCGECGARGARIEVRYVGRWGDGR